MEITRDEHGLTAHDCTPTQLQNLQRQLDNNNMEYSTENGNLRITFDQMYANLPTVLPRYLRVEHQNS